MRAKRVALFVFVAACIGCGALIGVHRLLTPPSRSDPRTWDDIRIAVLLYQKRQPLEGRPERALLGSSAAVSIEGHDPSARVVAALAACGTQIGPVPKRAPHPSRPITGEIAVCVDDLRWFDASTVTVYGGLLDLDVTYAYRYTVEWSLGRWVVTGCERSGPY